MQTYAKKKICSMTGRFGQSEKFGPATDFLEMHKKRNTKDSERSAFCCTASCSPEVSGAEGGRERTLNLPILVRKPAKSETGDTAGKSGLGVREQVENRQKNCSMTGRFGQSEKFACNRCSFNEGTREGETSRHISRHRQPETWADDHTHGTH